MNAQSTHTALLTSLGYSGVGVYTRQSVCAPIRAEEGLLGVLCPPGSSTPYRELAEDASIGGYPTAFQIASLGVDPAVLDAEGRCLVIEFPAFVLFGVYSPANSNGLRDDFRYGFLTALDTRIRNLAKMGKNVIIMKADLFRQIGTPEKGFGIALRAASVSYKAKLMPCLWAAVGLLANILNSLGDCASARRLVEGIIPQALEGDDDLLIGTLYSHLADSYMGLANPEASQAIDKSASPSPSSGSNWSTATNVARAELYIDRARECYKKRSYLAGECEQLMKKALIAKLRGDEKLAEEWAQNHNRVWEEGMRGIDD